MGLFNRYGTRYEERRRAKREVILFVGFIVLIILFLGGMWSLSWLGPRAVSEEDLRELEDIGKDEVDARRAEVARYLALYDALSENGEISEEDLDVLQLAIRKQRELVKLMDLPEARDHDQLAELEERFATQAGGVLRAASIKAEKASKTAIDEGRRADAITAIDRAIALQEQINLIHARGEHRDVPRLRRMQVHKANLEAEPLAQRAEELTQEARMIMLENPFKANALLREAVDLHGTLVREYRNSRFTNRSAQRAVEELLTDVEAAGLFKRREELREQAQVAVDADRYNDGAVLIEQAIEVQRDIISRFPHSSYAKSDALPTLEEERQTALSTGIARSAEAKVIELRELLRERQVGAAGTRAAELYRRLRQLHDQFQSSRYLDENRLLEVRFLNLKREDLGTIQDAVHERLRPVPGNNSVRMLSVEVPQLLFSLVMGLNPSSQKGDLLPVDSVDFSSALEFCERLGWIMGRPVRLPTRAEFESALGEVRPTELAGQAWSSQDAQRRTQEVGTRSANAQGFFDLLGNVSEWINEKRPGDAREALVIGGSVRESIQSIGRVPAAFVFQTERSRFTGFRVVVEIDVP